MSVDGKDSNIEHEFSNRNNQIIESNKSDHCIVTSNDQIFDILYENQISKTEPLFPIPSPSLFQEYRQYKYAVLSWKKYSFMITSKYILLHPTEAFLHRPLTKRDGKLKIITGEQEIAFQEFFLTASPKQKDLDIPYIDKLVINRRLKQISLLKREITNISQVPIPNFYSNYIDFESASLKWYSLHSNINFISPDPEFDQIPKRDLSQDKTFSYKQQEMHTDAKQYKEITLSKKATTNLNLLKQATPEFMYIYSIIKQPFDKEFVSNPIKFSKNSFFFQLSPFDVISQLETEGLLKDDITLPNNIQFLAKSVYSAYSYFNFPQPSTVDRLMFNINNVMVSGNAEFHFQTFTALQNLAGTKFPEITAKLLQNIDYLYNTAYVVTEFSHSITDHFLPELEFLKLTEIPSFLLDIYKVSCIYVMYSVISQHLNLVIAKEEFNLQINKKSGELRQNILRIIQNNIIEISNLNADVLNQSNSDFFCSLFSIMMRVFNNSSNHFLICMVPHGIHFFYKLTVLSPKSFKKLILPFLDFKEINKCLFTVINECILGPKFKFLQSNKLFDLFMSKILNYDRQKSSSFNFIGVFISYCIQIDSPSLGKLQYLMIRFLVDGIENKNALSVYESCCNLLQVELIYCTTNKYIIDAMSCLISVKDHNHCIQLNLKSIQFIISLMDFEQLPVEVCHSAYKLFTKLLIYKPKYFIEEFQNEELAMVIGSVFKTDSALSNREIVALLYHLIKRDNNNFIKTFLDVFKKEEISLKAIFASAISGLTMKEKQRMKRKISAINRYRSQHKKNRSKFSK
ncbi:hypothetical protein TVAG_350050 [Trichomonas vaginalis G3]|uniref:Uncharacterized protein n=1 Tax=Trichomonas vaginalis (strain ATCC PRA-98 / G3) TaxID=412133 RepID=A2F3I6_TRIV3|nr:hypothetical protein TVAGG3_0194340 [Trichomonas vaginalis G3]EAY00509.1 hypothetical protein TVAG_350050 [Trichomonas vaginalis G3]KAI5550200.1 hypothetical protein TVAGG3_0194340 [Trichomonas vaginalis G3]|eukprot:XP_001313438.1 hypothetical protein [Trichomonas vaginalis G3]